MNLAFGLKTIYDNAEFITEPLDKVGIVGVNGAGKTTLFRLLLHEIELDSGTLSVGNARIGYLPQEITIEDKNVSVWDYISAGRPIKKINSRLDEIYKKLETADESETTELLSEMGKLQDKLDYYGVYQADDELLDLAIEMNIDPDIFDKKMSEISGGQKSKIAFARVLFSLPEILLLDEPTNHLDVETKEFVTKYLKNYHGSVFIISHDVDFINAIVNKIMFINKVTHKISVYDGNYDTYKKKYAEEQRNRELLISRQEKEMKELSEFVQRANQASRTNHAIKRMGQDRAIKLEKKKQELLTRERVYKRVKMDIRPKREGALVPLEVDGLTFAYPGQSPLYRDLSFKLNGKERFLVVGENGVGKSTLLKLLVGNLSPQKGNIHYNPKTDVAYYAQELESLNLAETVLENVKNDDYTEWQLRAVLSNFLFYEDDVNKKVEVLSPGEKARIALCKILLQKANLLILDEPTNHLDPETQKIIGGNFNMFDGTIIVVSHNPAFVEQIGISRMLILPSGKIVDYSWELLEYFYELNTPEEEKY